MPAPRVRSAALHVVVYFACVFCFLALIGCPGSGGGGGGGGGGSGAATTPATGGGGGGPSATVTLTVANTNCPAADVRIKSPTVTVTTTSGQVLLSANVQVVCMVNGEEVPVPGATVKVSISAAGARIWGPEDLGPTDENGNAGKNYAPPTGTQSTYAGKTFGIDVVLSDGSTQSGGTGTVTAN